MSQAIEQGAGLTKDAMRIIASAAPKPIAQNDVVKQLTDMGYKVTDATSKALVDGLGRWTRSPAAACCARSASGVAPPPSR